MVSCADDAPTEPALNVATTIVVAPTQTSFDALGDTVRLTTEVRDQAGRVMTDVSVAWSSGEEAVATVDGAGLLTAVGNGTATVTAASGEAAGSAAVSVDQAAAEVRVSPDSVTFAAIGDTARLAAMAVDANGHAVADAEVAWSSGDTLVAVVDSAGLVTAVGGGRASVLAVSGEAAGSAAVTVDQAVAEVRVSPDSVTFAAIGDTARLAAMAVDANGHVVADAEVAWSSDDTLVAVVDSAGLVTAVGDGDATVAAVGGELVGGATVFVRAGEASDRRILEVFYEAAGGPSWTRSDNWLSDAPIGDWYGITTDPQGRVQRIELYQNGLTGTLLAEIGALDRLERLELGSAYGSIAICSRPYEPPGSSVRATGNALDGLGPPELSAEAEQSNWSWTRYDGGGWTHGSGPEAPPQLRLQRGTANRLTGRIPPELGDLSNLVFLNLSANGFSGPIPSELSQLPALQELRLAANRLSGQIPPNLGDLTQLRVLTLGFNLLSAGLPPTIGRLLELELLHLPANDLSGTLPPEMENLTSLEQLIAYGNGFVGPLPSVTKLVEMRHLDFTCNHLTGPIPEEIGELRQLERLAMFGNQFSGEMPVSIGNLSRLRTVNFGANYFLTGSLPPELGNLTGLEVLQLGSNDLTGAIPPELGNLTNLERLSLDHNDLSGPIPPELRNLTKLLNLLLQRNNLTGPVPPGVGNLERLQRLWLGKNDLTGPIPHQLGNLTGLRSLLLDSNDLTGPIPAELGNLAKLEWLWLRVNNLTGPVPPDLGNLTALRDLFLDGNDLTGPLPAELGNLAKLERLWLDRNNLTGPVPPDLGNLAALRDLFLDRNDLTGRIPAELGNLAKLERLWLARNNLTGPVPPDLGNLTALRHLLLHGNDLAGPIPAELGNLASLEWLLVSGNPYLKGALPQTLVGVPLDWFTWHGTGLCSPRSRGFPEWLTGIEDNSGEGPCRLLPRETFAAFYDATGGGSWAANTNWMTDAPVSSWHGITVEDSLVIALELPDNGLDGSLPPAVGDFADLQRLNLSGNNLAGVLPDDLAVLDSLVTLDLSDNEFEGTLPGGLADLGALREFDWANSGACAPEAGWFQGWLSGLARRSGPDCGGPFALEFGADAVTQASNSMAGPIPLIAGRAAAVPVFAAADRANDLRPRVRITIHSGAGSTRVEESALGSHRGIPTTLDAARLDQSTPVVIPGSGLAPGAELVVELDPDSEVPRLSRGPLRFPREGRLALDVREMPPMALTIVPVLIESAADTSVVGWIRDAGDAPVEFMRAVLPVGGLAVGVREPLVVSAAPESGAAWESLLQDIDLLRTTEGGTGYWYGAVTLGELEGVSFGRIVGIAYIDGRRASAGIPDAEVFAHEIGHNMGLLHAPCGGPWSVDPDYPYGDGSIGVWGWDPRTGEFREPATPELMSYCGGGFRDGPPQWISDYHFGKAMEHRLSEDGSSFATAATTADDRRASRLLLRGGVSPEGELRLDPAFVLDAPALTPGGGGPYRIRGHARDGREFFALNFDMTRDSQGGGGFLFLLPFEAGRLAGLSRIELAGPEGSVALDGRTPVDPVAMVIDRTTGRIRSILRGEAARRVAGEAAADAAGQGTGQTTVILVSTGVPDVSR